MEQRMMPGAGFHLRDRTADGPPTFDGVAVPYDTAARVGGVSEVFARGAFNPDQVRGLPILWQHDTHAVAGIITHATNTDDGLHITGQLIDTSWGRDATAAVRAGAVKGLSVGFIPGEETWEGNTVTRTSATLAELSLATIPAYPDAQLTAVRTEQQEEPMPDTQVADVVTRADLDTQVADVVTRADLDALEARMTVQAPAPAQRAVTVPEAFTAQLADSATHRQLRALADVIPATNIGVMPPSWSSQVRNYVDRLRYLIPNAGSIPFPTSGLSLTVPKVLVHTLVGPRGAPKTEVPSRALTTGNDTYTAEWYAGAVDISLELIWQSDPAIYELVVADLLQQYAQVTDAAMTLKAETAAGPTGAAIVWTNWGTVVGSILPQAEAIRVATGQFGDKLSLTTASWGKLIGLTDAGGRRILAPGGAQNADGSAALLARSVDIGGITAFHNPNAAEDMLYNNESVRISERPPVTVTQDVVALMGRDVGVLGAVLLVPWPAGIKVFSATE